VPQRQRRHRIIGMASPMLQEVFAGKLIGVNLAFNELDAAQKARSRPSPRASPAC